VLQFFINNKESQKKKEAYIRRYDDDLWTPLCVLSLALWEEKLPTAEIVVDHDETQTTEHRKQQVKERLGGSLPMLCCYYCRRRRRHQHYCCPAAEKSLCSIGHQTIALAAATKKPFPFLRKS
jgi:hypothetical protein